MTPDDYDLLIKAVLALLTTVVIPWAIMAYQKRTGVQVTDQQRAAVQATLTTAAGIIQTSLDQGKLRTADIREDHGAVRAQAIAALARVPDAATAQGMTTEAAAAIIVGRVDTSEKLVMGLPAPSIART